MSSIFHSSISVLICINQNVMSLPATDRTLSGSARVGPEGPEFWVQPCGSTPPQGTIPQSEPDYVLAEQYQMYLSMDLLYLEQWKENFVSWRIMKFNFVIIKIFSHLFSVRTSFYCLSTTKWKAMKLTVTIGFRSTPSFQKSLVSTWMRSIILSSRYVTSKNANIDHHLKVMLTLIRSIYSLLPC